MHRRQRMSVAFVKRDWGSGRKTWRRSDGVARGQIAMRRLSNRLSKKEWFGGTSIKAC